MAENFTDKIYYAVHLGAFTDTIATLRLFFFIIRSYFFSIQFVNLLPSSSVAFLSLYSTLILYAITSYLLPYDNCLAFDVVFFPQLRTPGHRASSSQERRDLPGRSCADTCGRN